MSSDKKPTERIPHSRRDSDMDVSHSIGYMLAKMEDLDHYIRTHMESEEKKFDVINKSIKRIQLAIMFLTVSVVLMAAGVPVDGLILKLLSLI